MIKLSPNIDKNLKLLLPTTNKALAFALKDASPTQLQEIGGLKDLNSILETLFKKNSNANETQNRALLELLKNNPTLKSLSNITNNIENLLTLLKKDTKDTQLEKTLQNLLTNIKEIEPKELQSKLKSSGVFLENQIKNSANPKEIFSKDFKALLLQTHDKLSNTTTTPNSQEILKHIDKLTLTIDYHQLISHLSNASSIYIPYSWNALKEGNINIKKAKNKNYLCDIHLELKEHGEVDLRLILFEKNQLNIYITTQSEALKKEILENLQMLKKQFAKVSIITKEIRFMTKKKQCHENFYNDNLAIGFEVKV